MKYMISFALPRFCDQSLRPIAQGAVLSGARATVDREARHGRPRAVSHRSASRTASAGSSAKTAPTRRNCHGPQFFEQVADMVSQYLDTRPDPGVYDFLRTISTTLDASTAAWSARASDVPVVPAALHRASGRAACRAMSSLASIEVEPLEHGTQPRRYTEDDLHVRQFLRRRVAAIPGRRATHRAA